MRMCRYVSDVTRTWPISGKFSGPQRDVYDAVHEVHRRWGTNSVVF